MEGNFNYNNAQYDNSNNSLGPIPTSYPPMPNSQMDNNSMDNNYVYQHDSIQQNPYLQNNPQNPYQQMNYYQQGSPSQYNGYSQNQQNNQYQQSPNPQWNNYFGQPGLQPNQFQPNPYTNMNPYQLGQYQQQTSQAPMIMNPQQSMIGKKFCKHCGSVIDVNCIICPSCGKQVEELPNAQPNIVIHNTNENNNINSVTYLGPGKLCNKWISFLLCFFLGYFGAVRAR